MNFKQFFREMASFSLPRKININGKDYVGIDMMFEKEPKTLDKNGKVMNQGSKFFAKLPDQEKYVVYDGRGYSQFSSPKKIEIFTKLGYEKVPDNWHEKANMIEESNNFFI